jgi:hypothetical protein
MNFIKKNCISILLVLLTLVMLITMFSGCKKSKEGYNNIIEGHSDSGHGKKYLNELKKSNDKQIKKIIKQIDSTSDASSELATLQKLTSADTAINAALKAGGGSSSWFGGDDTDSTSGSDTDDSNSDSSSSDDGFF